MVECYINTVAIRVRFSVKSSFCLPFLFARFISNNASDRSWSCGWCWVLWVVNNHHRVVVTGGVHHLRIDATWQSVIFANCVVLMSSDTLVRPPVPFWDAGMGLTTHGHGHTAWDSHSSSWPSKRWNPLFDWSSQVGDRSLLVSHICCLGPHFDMSQYCFRVLQDVWYR